MASPFDTKLILVMSVAYPDAKLTYLDTSVISSCPKLEDCTSRTKKNNKRLVAYSLRIILSIIKKLFRFA